MALVNPNIAMSFRQPEFRPRNALAEYAQVQQIVGGQRQAEVADMQLEDLRRNRATLNNIRQAIVAKGGPPDLDAAADEMIRSGNPDYMNQGIAIRDALQKQQRFEDYERQYGGGAGATTPTSAAGAITAPAPAAAPEGELVAAPITPPMGTMREIAPDGAAGAEMPLTRGANALAPAAAPASTNAMTAAQPAAPAPDVNALMRRYNLASRAGSPDAPVILKQIEAALRGGQNRPFVVGNRLVSPTGQELYVGPQGTASLPVSIAEFERAKTDPAFMQFLQDRAAAIRPPAAPATPSATAEKPPTPAQVAKDKRMGEARRALSKDIETQLGYYQKLADIGAMTSPTRSGVENVLAYARSSGPGQQLERAIGTDAQTLRDNIKNTRQRLFMQIKDATGATAGQMNSNVEMQAWLNSMTDPQQSIETVQETLKQLDSVIAGVQRQVAQEQSDKKSQAKPATAAPAPTLGRRDLGGGFKLVD